MSFKGNGKNVFLSVVFSKTKEKPTPCLKRPTAEGSIKTNMVMVAEKVGAGADGQGGSYQTIDGVRAVRSSVQETQYDKKRFRCRQTGSRDYKRIQRQLSEQCSVCNYQNGDAEAKVSLLSGSGTFLLQFTPIRT